MSNLKITDLSSLSQSALDASADFLLAVDVSDTTMSASGTNVKIAPKTLVGGTINDLIQTWNSGATAFTGFKLNVTDTASDTDSSLMDLQVAGSSKFRIKKDGTIYVNGSVFSGGSWGDITGTLSSQTDLQSALDAKLSLSGGTVTGQFINSIGTITTNTPCQIFQTWNNAATTFTGLYVRATVTAAQSDSSVAAFSTNSSDLWTIRSDGALLLRGSTQNTGLYWGGGNTLCIRSPGNGRGIAVDGWAQRLIIDNLSQGVQWDSSTPLVMSSHVLHMRNGASGQRLNIYGTYTDGSNYRRIYIASTTGGAFTLGVEGLGTGASGNTLTINNAAIFSDNISFNTALKGVRFEGGTCGFYGEYNETYWILNNTEYGRFTTNGIINSTYYGFASTARASSPDLTLVRESANTLAQRNDNNSQVFRMYRQYTDASNYSRFYVNTNASASKYEIGTQRAGTGGSFGIDFIVNGTKMIDFNAGNVDIYFSQRSITWGSANSGEVRLKQKTAFSSRLDVVDAAGDNNYSSFVLAGIWFWGTTSAHPYLKRSSTTLQARLGDDTGFGSFQGKLTTDTNYTAGAPTATGYLILYDATGTAYRVPAVLN